MWDPASLTLAEAPSKTFAPWDAAVHGAGSPASGWLGRTGIDSRRRVP
jgi:hypothetical protein